MPRRFRSFKRHQSKDTRYQDERVQMLINRIMQSGKHYLASQIVYDALDIASKRLKKDPMQVFEQALENVTPLVEVRARRIGGAAYQIPTEINSQRRMSLALRWLVSYARDRKGVPVREKLAAEIIDAYNNTGAAVKKKEETHRMAEANRALAHYSRF